VLTVQQRALLDRLFEEAVGLYSSEGNYAQAEALFTKILEVHRRVLGPENRDTLVVMYNLAEFYRREGRYEQAESLCVVVLEARRRVLGALHRHARYISRRACWPPVWLVKRSMRRPSLSCSRVIKGCSSGKPPFPRIAGRLWKRREGGLSGSTRIGASRKRRPPDGKRSRLAGLSPDS
jgi:hypothetical protein